MLHTLPESRPSRQRRGAGTLLSVAVHGTIIALAVVSTADGRSAPPRPREVVRPIVFPKEPPAEPRTAHRSSTRSGGTVVTSPVPAPTIDLKLPTIPGPLPPPAGPTRDIVTTGDFPPVQPGHGGGAGPGDPDGAWRSDQVETIAWLLTPPHPRYPEALRSAGIQGHVVLRFVVDTAGRVEPGSVTVVSSTHDLLAAAARATLPGLRFRPARAGDRPVRMVVELPFDFVLH